MATKTKTKIKIKEPSAAEFQKKINELNARLFSEIDARHKEGSEAFRLQSEVLRLEGKLYRRRTLLERLRDRLRKWLGVPGEARKEPKTPYSSAAVAASHYRFDHPCRLPYYVFGPR